MTTTITIDDKTYHAQLIEAADRLTKSGRDGRISKDDAMELYHIIRENEVYTDLEKATIAYIRKNYKWTKAADYLFRTQTRRWATSKR